jgi:sugar (pentulose or hexulose) kinase
MSEPAEALLAIDVGSSSTRVAAVAPGGGVLRVRAAPTPIGRPGPGREEIDVERVWDVVRGLVGELDVDSLRVRAVGVSALLGTVFFDEVGEPLRPALSWSDTRAREWAAEPPRAPGAADPTVADAPGRPGGPDRPGGPAALVRDRARRRATGELVAARMAWLRAEEPGLAARVARVASIKDAILARLAGRLVTDPTHASYTGLYDVVAREWSADLCAAGGVEAEVLPPVLGAGEPLGVLEPAVAAALGLPARAVVAVGAPDGTAGVLGAGAARAGQAVDIAGTTDVLMRLVAEPVADPRAATVLNDYLVPGLWALGGPTGMTGGAVEWVARLAGFDDLGAALAALGPEIERIGPGADGVAFRTELSGSRFPTWDPAAAGAITGLRPTHGPAHLLRAAREGAAFTVAAGLAAIRDLGAPVERLTVAGGLARDPSALQLRADVCGIPVDGCTEPQVTTLGTAMLAGQAAGLYASAAEACAAIAPAVIPYEPNPEASAAYAKRGRPKVR